MHQLKGLYGAAYSCSHAGISYCDDWYTLPYKNTYDNVSNKKSLQHLRSLGFNMVRTYYLDPNRDHTDFLTQCEKNNLSVEIGISNNLLDSESLMIIAIDVINNSNISFSLNENPEFFNNLSTGPISAAIPAPNVNNIPEVILKSFKMSFNTFSVKIVLYCSSVIIIFIY